MDKALPWLILLGLGGVALWLLLRKPVSAQAPCGVPISAYGTGAVIPCGAVKDALNITADTVGSFNPVALLPNQVKQDAISAGLGQLRSGNTPLGVSAAIATAPAYKPVTAAAQANAAPNANPLKTSVAAGTSAWDTFKSYF